ncbi:MAG: glycosyltransferase family 39 protein [Burkholderiaceae bacterium]|nr:glycosyltransferase family 39 protein [Burkholderiaceae bacterium]
MTASSAPARTVFERLLRPGRVSPRDTLLDLVFLVGLALLLMAVGLGLRDPWPADEPRFALVAQDMLRSGDWLIPRVGGDLYADKPPFFFWLLATAMALTGSLQVGFLLPSLLAGVGATLLVYDLLRRARGREVALSGAFLLLLTFQFTWQMRHAQIDGVLCFLTTLSLYGLLRHVLLGPAPGWFVAGWAVAGLGVITKGVGFLPLLALVPLALLARRGWKVAVPGVGSLSLVGAAAMLVAIGLWFVPMMVATSAGGDLLAYRNEILFQQTVTRYADAWHHHEPVWYYFTNVIPVLWLPLVALVPWLWPRWRDALRARDTLVAVLLAWVVIVVAFFTASSGKRGLYVLPAVPALAMAAAPWLPELLRAQGTRRLAFGLASLLVGFAAVAGVYFAVDSDAADRILLVAAVVGAIPLLSFRARDGWLAYAGVLAALLGTVGLVVYPRIDDVRSGRALMERLEEASADFAELGLASAKEQYLLQLRRPSFNFGHARWREREVEAADAAAWLAERPGRALLVERRAREACFSRAEAMDLGRANRQRWFLVWGEPDQACVERGDLTRVRLYLPPDASLDTDS